MIEDRAPIVARRMHIIIGRGDIAPFGIELPRQIFPEALPIVLTVARNPQAPVTKLTVMVYSTVPKMMSGNGVIDA